MCNRLHENSEPIPKVGYGWKIFRKVDKEYKQWNVSRSYTKAKRSLYIKWDDGPVYGDGFCFFLQERDAREFLKKEPNWEEACYVIRKIKYQGGLGKHREYLSGDFMMGLCKQFKILEED